MYVCIKSSHLIRHIFRSNFKLKNICMWKLQWNLHSRTFFEFHCPRSRTQTQQGDLASNHLR